MPKAKADLRSLARSHTETAIKTLVGIMRQPKANPSARVAAAQALLDRGWGKADQTVDVRHTVSAEPMSEHEWTSRYGADLEAAARPAEKPH